MEKVVAFGHFLAEEMFEDGGKELGEGTAENDVDELKDGGVLPDGSVEP